MTFDDVRKFALAWPEVEDGTSYGTPALKVRKKLLARLKEDGDSLVMPGVPLDEREMLVESQPKIFYFTDHYRDYPMVLIRLSKAKRAIVEPLLRRHWRTLASKKAVKESTDRRVGKGALRRAHHLSRQNGGHASLCPPYGAVMNQAEFLTAALRNPVNEIIAEELFELALPDAWLVSGCLVQTVWNVLTGRAVDYGINDYDVFYFDPDTSWEAEDAVIRTLHDALAHLGVTVEARNQARVHLWYAAKARPALPAAALFDRRHRPLPDQEHQDRHPPHADGYDVYAPDGFDDAANLIVRPNPGPNFSAANYAAKAARWKALWPEVTVLPAET